ncbi:MAG: SIS domain-containing protein [Candidatus Omnitrophica bacterium]|nr:SIS domain-containing protein [Candidatus Omnitrophota bacterium]
MDNTKEFEKIFSANVKALQDTFLDPRAARTLNEIALCIVTAIQNGGKIMLCGNGGSAADAQHIAGEFIGRYKRERKAFPAIALTTDTSILTCVANDYSFDDIFKRQLEGLGRPGDVLIAISTSGNSKNVIRAVTQARAMKITTISFTGGDGGALKDSTDHNFNIGHKYTPFVQSGHEIALHALCEVVEKILVEQNV